LHENIFDENEENEQKESDRAKTQHVTCSCTPPNITHRQNFQHGGGILCAEAGVPPLPPTGVSE